jgi:hypothetical protein
VGGAEAGAEPGPDAGDAAAGRIVAGARAGEPDRGEARAADDREDEQRVARPGRQRRGKRERGDERHEGGRPDHVVEERRGEDGGGGEAGPAREQVRADEIAGARGHRDPDRIACDERRERVPRPDAHSGRPHHRGPSACVQPLGEHVRRHGEDERLGPRRRERPDHLAEVDARERDRPEGRDEREAREPEHPHATGPAGGRCGDAADALPEGGHGATD